MVVERKSIPFVTLALKRDRVAREQIHAIKATLSEHFDYEVQVTLHTLPVGVSTARVEFATHSDVALARVFNVLGEWNAI